MTKTILLIIFILVAVAQLATPLSMVWNQEVILRTGTPYKFRTRPIDPPDLFRGRYVQLGYDAHLVHIKGGTITYHQLIEAYALIVEASDGYARFTELSLTPPEFGDYLKTEVYYVHGGATEVRVPFDRFYMPEYLAPEAESAYRTHSLGAQRDAYVVVRVKNGVGVIEDLFLAGKPIMEFLRESKQE